MRLENLENINNLNAEAFKSIRKRLGLSQKTVADLFDEHASTICCKESGREKFSRLETLAMLYLDSVASREKLMSVSDLLQGACVAIEMFASNATLQTLEGITTSKGGAK